MDFCSVFLLIASLVTPQKSHEIDSLPCTGRLSVDFKIIELSPFFTDALRTCLIGQVCGMSGKFIINLTQ